jgi:hypothetical protein
MMTPDVAAQHAGRIDAIMKPNGITEVWKDGLKVSEEPTHPSQIRPPRESMLWKPGEDEPLRGALAIAYTDMSRKNIAARGTVLRIDPTYVTIQTTEGVVNALRDMCSLTPRKSS